MTTGYRSITVPEGLDGMRVDAAVAKVFGVSRSVAAELEVLIDGTVAPKSTRLTPGQTLEVTLPEPKEVPMPKDEPVEGLEILYDDEDVIVVDKPVGVADRKSVV